MNLFYFFIICLNIFLLLVVEVHLERYRWYPYVVHFFGMGLSIGFSIVLYATGNVGVGLSPWCSVTANDNYFWMFMFIYAWMLLFLALDAVMTVMIVGKLFHVRYQVD